MKVVFVKPVQPTPYPSDGVSPLRWVPEKGARVRDAAYWRRREAEGAVTITELEGASTPAPTEEA